MCCFFEFTQFPFLYPEIKSYRSFILAAENIALCQDTGGTQRNTPYIRSSSSKKAFFLDIYYSSVSIYLSEEEREGLASLALTTQIEHIRNLEETETASTYYYYQLALKDENGKRGPLKRYI